LCLKHTQRIDELKKVVKEQNPDYNIAVDKKLREWEPNTASPVRQRIMEIIDLADHDVLDIMQSRLVEQEVLNILDEPATR